MKRFRHTWFNGMLEDPKGMYCKMEDHLGEWRALHSEYADEKIKLFLIFWLLSLSILGNIGQLIYHLNI